SSRRRHTRSYGDWSSDVCSSDLGGIALPFGGSFFFFLLLTCERANDLALRVQNFELRGFFGLSLQPIVQSRAIWGIFADGITPRIEMAHARAPGRARREEMRIFRRNRSGRLPQRADIVEHPERTPVRGRNEIVIMHN